jgi:hypothetical protein
MERFQRIVQIQRVRTLPFGGGGTVTVTIPGKVRLYRSAAVIFSKRMVPLAGSPANPITMPSRRILARILYPRPMPRFVPLPVSASPVIVATRTRTVQRSTFRRSLTVLPVPGFSITLYVPIPGKTRQIRSIIELRRSRYVPLPATPSPAVIINRMKILQRTIQLKRPTVLPLPTSVQTVFLPIPGRVRQIRTVQRFALRQQFVFQSLTLNQTVMVKSIKQVR